MSSTIPVLPESAPFSPAQRAWLNGFFAGLVGGVPATVSSSSAAETHVMAAPVVEAEEGFPWHDPALGIAERMELAADKSPERQLMAAMAQLDCGACGYLCKTYAEAIAGGSEKDLTRCAPGGKETSVKLKELVKLRVSVGHNGTPANHGTAVSNGTAGNGTVVKAKPARPAAQPGVWTRDNPYPARLLHCAKLNGEASAKDTRHVVFDLRGSGLTYQAGDALGVWPENCDDLVDWTLNALDASGAESVVDPDGQGVSLREALTRHYVITAPKSPLLELLARVAMSDAEKAELTALAESDDGLPEGVQVIDLLHRYRSAKPEPGDFVAALAPIQPRLYSISSSPKAHAEEVHLTIGVVRFVNPHQRQCKGVASTFLSERVRPGHRVRIFVHPAHNFAPPENPDAPMIMVGPGTGIAPFRAFLQDRFASGATGPNWLFFGDQSAACDFLYQKEMEDSLRHGHLTRLDTAFSRDQAEKVYVQHRMLEHGTELWAWLNRGGQFYVCGDAKRMASDVDTALKRIVAEHGRMSEGEAREYVAGLARSKRYQRDVY